MSDGFSKPLDGKALLIDAVVDRYGERCSDYQAGCACCAAWRAIDRIEELEAKLAAAVEALADMYRLHLRRGPAWDHEPTRAILDKTRATLAELTGGKDE